MSLNSCVLDLKKSLGYQLRAQQLRLFCVCTQGGTGKANGLEICRTQKQHPHGTTNRLTVEAALVRGLPDNMVIVNTVSTM